jgi:GTP cyclohydrolase I
METCEMNEEIVAFHIREMMEKGLGLDLTDSNLKDTPDRIARTYCREFFAGLNPDNTLKISSFPNNKNYDEIIMLDNIPFVSMCSHHFLPFPGLAWFLYIPDDTLIGASKPARAIEFFSKLPQLQENIASQVVDHFMEEIKPKGVMLVMRAVHNCMSCRGVKSGQNAGMVTSITRGCFRENLSTRTEALSLIQLSLAFK